MLYKYIKSYVKNNKENKFKVKDKLYHLLALSQLPAGIIFFYLFLLKSNPLSPFLD